MTTNHIPSADETLNMLAKERKYPIRISNRENPHYVTERVFVNGVCIQIHVGEDVEVPATVRKLLIEKGVI